MEQNLPTGELNRYLYSHWAVMLKNKLSSLLGRQINYIQHRNQIRIEVNGDDAYYTLNILAGSSSDDENAVNLVLTLLLNLTSDQLSIIHHHIYGDGNHAPIHLGVETDQHLIPKLYDDRLREKEAKRFLNHYCPEAIENPMPVPIRCIMEQQMGLKVNADFNIPSDSTLAYTIFNDQVVTLTQDSKDELRYLDRGTVVIDSDTALLYGIGTMNFTLAHEAYHWFAHRAYVDFHKKITELGDIGDDIQAGTKVCFSYNGLSKYNTGDILEIQANAMASRILLPKKQFILKYQELAAGTSDIHTVISQLASFFKASYSAVVYRLSGLGLIDVSTPSTTTVVTPFEAYKLCEDDDFRKLVDSGEIVYVGSANDQHNQQECDRHSLAGHYVINDPKYVTLVWDDVPKVADTRNGGPYKLTEYAEDHPDEAFVSFTIDHRRIADDVEKGVLRRESNAGLKAQVDRIRRLFPDTVKEVQREADRFQKTYETESGKHKDFCTLAKEFIEYRYGRKEDFYAGAKERSWDPEDEMPEIHRQYFAGENEDVDEIKDRYQDNLAPRERDDIIGIIVEEASSPVELFCADTLQPRSTYDKILKGMGNHPEVKKLMCLCVGMCLSPAASKDLFLSAGRVLTWNREDMVYRYILTNLRGMYIENVNLFLDDLGLKPIGSATNTKES